MPRSSARVRWCLLTLGLIGSVAVGYPGEQITASSDAELEDLLSELRSQHRLPALAAAVVRSDGEIDLGVVGIRRLESEETVQAGDLFHVGSVTKSMTATMLATLVEQGEVEWDSTIADLAPDLIEDVDPAYRTVTLRQLLSHTAGLTDPWTAEQWASLPHDKATPGSQQRLQLARGLLAQPPKRKPGLDWHYANTGYTIATALVERLTGKEWEALMQDRLFAPLDLASAGFGWPVTADRQDQPWGHVVESESGPGVVDGLRVWGPDHPHRIPTVIAPAGDVHMSIGDFARYALLHLRGLRGQPTAIVSADSFAELHRPVLEGYALGWNVVPEGTSRVPGVEQYQHLGSGGTFTAVIAIFPTLDLGVVAVHNGGSNTAAIGDVMYTLVEWARESRAPSPSDSC